MNSFILILRLLFFPFSIIYYFVVKTRNYLYDSGIISQISHKTPIVSVGNITTGGTGKTPFVIFLIEYFLKHNKRVGIIARGYKRRTNKLVIAYDGSSLNTDVKQTGDEMGMIINRFSDIKNSFYAITHSDRIKAIKEMEIRYSPDIILLDDAFQNRKIKKDIDIVLLNKERKTILDNILLPAGNLREPMKAALKRADLVINNYKFTEIREKCSINYSNKGFFNLDNQRVAISEDRLVITVSGIADNSSFINAVKLAGFKVIRSFTFLDHFDYNLRYISEFESHCQENTIILTTEKDFVKLKEFKDFITKYPVYYLRIDVNLDIRIIEETIRKKQIL